MNEATGDGGAEKTFAELFDRLRAGDDQAAWDLVETYGPHVMRAIRRTLSQELRGKFDSDDFAQAVWASFFSALDQLGGMKQPQQLVGLLTTMARNKVVDEIRRRVQTQKYAIRREQPMVQSPDGETGFLSRDPRPSQMAIARERWIQMLHDQPEHYRQVMRLRLMGRTQRSIAVRLGLSEKTVHRVLEALSKVG